LSDTDARRKRLQLIAYGYPARINTSGGKFFWHRGYSVNIFDSLSEAVTYAVREIQRRNAPLSQ
jgi:hypothetical protein